MPLALTSYTWPLIAHKYEPTCPDYPCYPLGCQHLILWPLVNLEILAYYTNSLRLSIAIASPNLYNTLFQTILKNPPLDSLYQPIQLG